jgi:hypothetical protein
LSSADRERAFALFHRQVEREALILEQLPNEVLRVRLDDSGVIDKRLAHHRTGGPLPAAVCSVPSVRRSSFCASRPLRSAESGADAPSREQYSYNDENDMTSQVSTPASGAAALTLSAYPAAGSPQPQAATSDVTGVGLNACGLAPRQIKVEK